MTTLRIHELPAQERPREKLAALGAGALSDSELIAILLRTGMQGANAIDVARKLLAEYQSLSGLARCTVAELSKIKGVGPAKAVQLAAAFGLASRLARETLVRQPGANIGCRDRGPSSARGERGLLRGPGSGDCRNGPGV